MKLYTEQHMINFLEWTRMKDALRSGEILMTPKEMLEKFENRIIAIEVPTDYEIEQFAIAGVNENEDSRWFEPLQVGAKWMRDTLTNGINNETEQY